MEIVTNQNHTRDLAWKNTIFTHDMLKTLKIVPFANSRETLILGTDTNMIKKLRNVTCKIRTLNQMV